jgi:hypothetical protein
VRLRKAGAGKRGGKARAKAKRPADGKKSRARRPAASGSSARRNGSEARAKKALAEGTSVGNGQGAERAAASVPAVVDRGSPPPLPSPIASFNF